jgi:chromosome segregation protein
MRLRKVKMAGFKSFVDPTTIIFPSDMVGVVGPNGCGKSNIIDAVRWVMGESSRHLRGDSMEDVIFNGSAARKPIGQASIELIFDNSEGRAGGQYAHYNEISIRRQLFRDGQSKYFLNGSRCRRRDITDIFLGTGLGPRSYAIMEQGMISQLIEAKPEELRIHIEEAAGISKYKERRRETENRIRHTRDNMDRLNDVREEVEKQLNHLSRQARTAERFQKLKQEEHRLKAEVMGLRWQALDREEKEQAQRLQTHQTSLEQTTAQLRSLEAAIEKQREQRIEANEVFNEVQGQFYRVGGDISRTEQSIQHARAMRERQLDELRQTGQTYKHHRTEISQDRTHLEQLISDITAMEIQLASKQEQHALAAAQQAQIEATMARWQEQWDELTRHLSGPHEAAQVERARMEQLERQLTQLEQREARLKDELSGLSVDDLNSEFESLQAQGVKVSAQYEQHQSKLNTIHKALEERRERNEDLDQQLDEARSQLQNLRGQLISLEALQEAALGKHQKEITDWLHQNNLVNAPRLAERLSVQAGWEHAVEMVLGYYLEAVCVESINEMTDKLMALEHGHLTLFDTTSQALTRNQRGPDAHAPLLSKVRSPWPIEGFLQGIYTADNLHDALRLSHTLSVEESVITADGFWIGSQWLRMTKDTDEHAGVLAREGEIKSVTGQLNVSHVVVEDLQQNLTQGREVLQQLEQARENAQMESNRAHRAEAETEARLNQVHSKLEQVTTRKRRLQEERVEIRDYFSGARTELEQSIHRRNEALQEIDVLSGDRERLRAERDAIKLQLDESRMLTRQQRDEAHQLALRLESARSTRASTQQHIDRMEVQLVELGKRLESLQAVLDQSARPLQEQEQTLEGLLARRMEVERTLNEARTHVQALDSHLQELDHERIEVERRIEALRAELENVRLIWQEVKIRCQTIQEQVSESGFTLQALVSELEPAATLEEWEQRAESVSRKIDKLGPINLAAIDEFREQSQRKEYLDSQHADLTEALETLENAIRKIDKETRQRFKETFERVNNRMQEMFPRLFGGGEAFLEMTGNDLLTTGISIMARPPGKRLSTIHLMSGGEKALTAVAMVFAIFELNPAPFCLLDEVDAPLDEANVGRFCELIKELRERVQFIFVTHNKTTMEFADQLIGVTMNEPGVSRLVEVDVDEAVQMATG